MSRLDNMNEIRKIKALLDKYRISQNTFADKCGIKRPTFRQKIHENYPLLQLNEKEFRKLQMAIVDLYVDIRMVVNECCIDE